MRHFSSIATAILLASSLLATNTFACTRTLWVTDQAVVTARTMDFRGDIKSDLWVLPRGIEHDGFADVNSLHWKSKYGSIVTTSYNSIATDGMNEKGLGVHILLLPETDYGPRDVKLPGMSVLMWEQFYIDNFSSVDEAIRYTQTNPYQLEPFDLDEKLSLHLVLDDASGDSAIIEFIGGKMHIYHDRAYNITANEPSFDQHLKSLPEYLGFGGTKPLPGSTNSADRFVRAAFYTKFLPKPVSSRDAIIKILSIMSNTALPYGISTEERPAPAETVWYSAADLTHLVYYFISTGNHELMWTNLNMFNLKEGAPVMKLNTSTRGDYAGDVTNMYKPSIIFGVKHPSSRARGASVAIQ